MPFSGGGSGSGTVTATWANFTPATTGITGESSAARYVQIGKVVLVSIDLTGTSNATTKSFTLPVTPGAVASMQWIVPLTVKDNGVVQGTPGEVVIDPSSTTANIYKTSSGSSPAWTGSGTWFAIGVGLYESV